MIIVTIHEVITLLTIEKECLCRNIDGSCERVCQLCDIVQLDDMLKSMYDISIERLSDLERPMTLKEALDSTDPCIFLETNPSIGDKIYAVRLERLYDGEQQPVETCEVYQIGIESPIRLFLQFYGKTWRCWKSNPTREDRLSVDWDV